MQFKERPLPVSFDYRKAVADTLAESRVTYTGMFDDAGTFDVVRLGEKTEMDNTTPMWALNLLRFTSGEDGIRTTRRGFLNVYHGRMTMQRGDRPEPVHTMDPFNVRFVDGWKSFRTKVRESGWVFDRDAALKQRADGTLTSFEQLEEILVNAEAGQRPNFYDNRTNYVKIEPGHEGRFVQVIRFAGVEDLVVVDIEKRQLLGTYADPILSQRRWEPGSVANTQAR